MAPKMSTYDSRERATEAFDLRSKLFFWREVCERLGYRSVGAAQSAVNRYVERERRGERMATSIEAHKKRIKDRTRALDLRLAYALHNGDDAMAVDLDRAISRNEAELAKLGGYYAPDQVDVNVTQSASAILDRAEADLLALSAAQPKVIDAEVVNE